VTVGLTLETDLPAERPVGVWARWMALVSLYAMAAGAVWSPPLVLLGEFVILGVAIGQVGRAPQLFLRSGLFWLAIFFVVYVVVRGAVAAVERPDLATLHWEGVRRWVKAGPLPVLMVAIAFALAGRRRVHIRRVLLTALLVLTADLLLRLEPLQLLAALRPDLEFAGLDLGSHGRRYVFGRHVALTSLLYSLALVGLVALGTGAAWRWRHQLGRWVPIAIVVGFLVAFYATALVAGGARASWLATLTALLAMAGALVFHGRSSLFIAARRHRRLAALFVGALLAVAVVGGGFLGERISGRFAEFGKAPAAAAEVVSGERALAQMPDGPVGDRVAYYVFGLQLIAQRPLIGYGPARPRHLVFTPEAPYQIEDRQSHWHSQYLDAMLRFGALGFVPLLALFALAVLGTVRGWRQGRIGGEYVLFMLGAVTVYSIWSLADQRFTNYTMIAVVSLVLGAGCSFLLRPVGDAPRPSRVSVAPEGVAP